MASNNGQPSTSGSDMAAIFQKLSFNPGASEFVPGQAFVPPVGLPSMNSASNHVSGDVAPPPKDEPMSVPQPPVEKPPPPEASEDWEKQESPEQMEDEEDDEPIPAKPKVVVEPGAPKKEHLNIVFCGHVDAGKSTIGGHILFLAGQVDTRTLEKYEKEAKALNRESWFYAWALDTNADERNKGITVEVGRAHFETEKKRFTVLDAPGHKSFVPNMIGGAAQADIAILVISARRGEFETGFEKGGQTREHAMLVKTAGVKHVVVLINKMDEQTVQWEEARYLECKEKLVPFLRSCGFRKNEMHFMPCSGFTGAFLTSVPDPSPISWYDGPSLLDYLDSLPELARSSDGPVRLPVVERYNDMGLLVMGKLESGSLQKGGSLMVMPNKAVCEVGTVMNDEDEVMDGASAGDNIKLRLKNVTDLEVTGAGNVICSIDNVCHTAQVFDAHVFILDYKSIICPGFSAIMHVHTAVEEVTVKILICTKDKKTGAVLESHPKLRFLKQDDAAIIRIELSNPQNAICIERFDDFAQLGRFTLRDEGKTIAMGKVLKIVR